MEGVCENIGADKHRSRIITECQQILRFTFGDFSLTEQISSQFCAHRIPTDKAKQECIGAVHRKPE